jgi:hypothetical protein
MNSNDHQQMVTPVSDTIMLDQQTEDYQFSAIASSMTPTDLVRMNRQFYPRDNGSLPNGPGTTGLNCITIPTQDATLTFIRDRADKIARLLCTTQNFKEKLYQLTTHRNNGTFPDNIKKGITATKSVKDEYAEIFNTLCSEMLNSQLKTTKDKISESLGKAHIIADSTRSDLLQIFKDLNNSSINNSIAIFLCESKETWKFSCFAHILDQLILQKQESFRIRAQKHKDAKKIKAEKHLMEREKRKLKSERAVTIAHLEKEMKSIRIALNTKSSGSRPTQKNGKGQQKTPNQKKEKEPQTEKDKKQKGKRQLTSSPSSNLSKRKSNDNAKRQKRSMPKSKKD